MNVPFVPDISINEVMVAQIDHASHFIWDAANPENALVDVDWEEVEHHAIQLISSRSAISMGGTGVNDAMWIAQTSWRDYVNLMNDGAVLALTSARAQDMPGLTRAGDILVDSCEACHQQYKPSSPTEGYSHPH
jgi:cytochrome c556